jgi:hypothetical protein
VNSDINLSVRTEGETAVIFAGDYLNKLSGEKIERECRRRLAEGCKTLLGVIDAANDSGAKVVFSGINDDTIELFEMLGLTNHVAVEN